MFSSKFTLSFYQNGISFCSKSIEKRKLFNHLFSTSSQSSSSIPKSDQSNILNSFVRASLFKSTVSIDYWNLIGNQFIFKAYLHAIFTIYRPITTKSMLNPCAASIILMFPLCFIVISTEFVERVRILSKGITLPIYIWRLVDKFCIRVVRPISGSKPGLDGVIYLANVDRHNFVGKLKEILSPEFIYVITRGTIFQDVAYIFNHKARIDPHSGLVIREAYTEYRFTIGFQEALNSMLTDFNHSLYSREFIDSLDLFFTRINAIFYSGYGITLVTKDIAYLETPYFGVHKLRNSVSEFCFVMSSSAKDSFVSNESQNLLLCFLYLFNPKFILSSKSNMPFSASTCTVLGDIILDLDTLNYQQMFTSLFSLSVVQTPEGGENMLESDDSSVKPTKKHKRAKKPSTPIVPESAAVNPSPEVRMYSTTAYRSSIITFDNCGRNSRVSYSTEYIFKWPVIFTDL